MVSAEHRVGPVHQVSAAIQDSVAHQVSLVGLAHQVSLVGLAHQASADTQVSVDGQALLASAEHLVGLVQVVNLAHQV